MTTQNESSQIVSQEYNEKRMEDGQRREERREEQNKQTELLQPEVDITEGRVYNTDLHEAEQTVSSSNTTVVGQLTPGGPGAQSSARSVAEETESEPMKEDIIYVSLNAIFHSFDKTTICQ